MVQRRPMKVFLYAVMAVSMLLPLTTGATGIGGQGHKNPNTDGITAQPGQDRTYALVQLRGDPLATDVRTKPAHGHKIDFNSKNVRSYRAQLSSLRNDFKQWLRTNAPAARVTGEYDISLNAVSVQLNGVNLPTIAASPLVQRVEYEGLYYPTLDDPDLNLIDAEDAWNENGGSGNAGAGIKVAILDTGIDQTHPCFDDTGYDPIQQLGDTRFTNNKVIAAKVFNNKTPGRHYTPEALQEHGTHVAGTVACNFDTAASVDGVAIPHGISGVAPRALLGNYNIFPADVLNARSEDIMNALDAAYQDGFDVANMSLGGGTHGIQDLLTIAVDNLDEANMVVAVAAGNSGPGHYTVESPGSAARALTAGASTVAHFMGAPITVDGNIYAGAIGNFNIVSATVTAPLAVIPGPVNGLSTACTPFTGLNGEIALISRGTCSFSMKIRNTQNAGASVVIVANNLGGLPIKMGQDGTPDQPTVPAYMVSMDDIADLIASDGHSTTVGTLDYVVSANGEDVMADFSGQGPTDVDFRVKPDVVAPGVNVLSSIPHQFCDVPPCFAFFQGTSMATPHLAGSAAIVRQQHPDWDASEVRSAIVNTAEQGVLKKYNNPAALETDVNITGAGRENLFAAVTSQIAIDPVSVSFGSVPSGSGQTQTFNVTLTNLSDTAGTFDLTVTQPASGVAYSVSPASISLGAGESRTVTVTMTAQRGAAAGFYQGLFTVSTGGTEVAHAAVFTMIK